LYSTQPGITSGPCDGELRVACPMQRITLGTQTMSKRTTSIFSVSLFALALIFGAAGTAVAGDKSCGGKKPKDDGTSAVVAMPEMPRA
jgi:hypothetical protein